MSNQLNIESLEHRTFLSVAQISFPNFSNTTNLVENGYDSSKVVVGKNLRLTDNAFHQARSIWYDKAVPIEKFRADFSFRSSKNTDGADGLTFAIINGPTSTLGGDGNGLGFMKINVPSEAVAFNQFNFGTFGSQFGFASNGERPPTNEKMKSIDLHSGHVFKVTVSYDGATMTAAVTDATTRGETFVSSQKINLPQALETSDAIVGFTAGTGANRATQEILSWSFSGQHAPAPAPAPAPVPSNPAVSLAASASPSPVRTRSTTLSVLGADALDAQNKLTYTWTPTQVPNGGKTPVFSVNGTNQAKSTSARFYKEGIYKFRATIRNSAGLSSTSDVTVRVLSSATYVGIDPHTQEVTTRGRMTFAATMYDQFRRLMKVQPVFAYAVSGEPDTGTIDPVTGAFKAGRATGHVDIAATALGLTGTVGVTVIPE
ncbi:MAG: hypothetical protein H7Z14_14960 [Anaerolineae bacterium]|nr:hypothetical protein [Phycisphaerae bacterium]